MSGMNDLNEGARLFREKKEKCLHFLEKAVALAKEYETAFPPAANEEGVKTRAETFAEIEKKLASDKLKILVAGQFKQGKSTLINALLGEEVLPAYSTPCTAVITEISYDDHKRAIISFKEKIQDIPQGLSEKARKHIGGKRENIPDLVVESDDLGEELEEYLVIPEDEDKEQREAVAESPYSVCKLKWPLELCRQEVEIIDSPGLNEATARDATTYTYVPQADMILHVLNANQLFGKPDKEFVEKVEGAGGAGILFLVNRFDQLNTPRDRDRVRDRALKELPEYTEHGANGIFFVSSYKALNGRMEDDATLYAESGFPKFERKMADIITKDRARIKLGGGLDAANAELDIMAREYLPALRHKMDQNVFELEKKFAETQSEFRKLEDRKERIERTIEKGLGSVHKMLKNELRIFFRDFAADSISSYTGPCRIEIKFFRSEESKRAAIQKLNDAVFDGLKSELAEFVARKQVDIQEIIEDMRDTVEEQLKDFNEILGSIRSEMDMDNKSLDVRDINVEGGAMSEMLGEGFAGALVGGAAGAGAAWVAGQFFAIMAGPVGWGVALAAALGSAILALVNSSSAEDKVKAEFEKEMAKRIRQESDRWATELAEKMSQGIDQTRINMIEMLNRKIAETKNPIIEAIDLLKKDQGNLEEKKKELDTFQKEFSELYKEGKELRQSILAR